MPSNSDSTDASRHPNSYSTVPVSLTLESFQSTAFFLRGTFLKVELPFFSSRRNVDRYVESANVLFTNPGFQSHISRKLETCVLP